METEQGLIRRCREGDNEALASLIERYQGPVYSLTLRLVSNREDAADLTQEVFYRALLRIKNFRGDCSLLTWLYRIATNACYDFLRARKHRPVCSLDATGHDDLSSQLADDKPGPAEVCVDRAVLWQLQEILKTLPIEQRSVLILRDVQGLSYEEIAQVLQCSLGTVKSRLSRSRRVLRDKLSANRELFFEENVNRL